MLKGKINSIESIYNETYEAFKLSWDTEYFGMSSARVILKDAILNEGELSIFLDSYDFITITNLNNNPQNNQWLGKYKNAFLVDVNIQFVKRLSNKSTDKEDITEVHEGYPYNESIIKIAQEAFKHSRFFNDEFLPLSKARDVYKHWVKSAFNKLGRYFVTVKRNGKIAGFLLFSINDINSFATIELIAVDMEFRGQKIGKTLISGMEKYLAGNNIELIKVGTQVNNISAINFYNSYGFKNTNCSSVYHYWPKK